MVASSEKRGISSLGQVLRTESQLMTTVQQPYTSAMNNKMLWWLLRYPLQRVEDIVLALQVSPNTVYRRLTRLIEEGLIEYVTPSLSVKTTCRLYYLSNSGILAAAAHEQTDAGTLARAWAADEKGLQRLLPRLTTLVHLQDLINGLITHAPSMLTSEKRQHTDLAWHWQRDYQHRFLANGRTLYLQADATLLLYPRASYQIIQGAGKDDYYCTLLFSDPGFVGHNDHALIAQKLEVLFHYRSSLEWTLGPELFPPILVLVQTARQREIWQHYAIEIAASLHVTPLTGAIVDLVSHEATDSTWMLPWQKLSEPMPCHLPDIFVALPKRSLPPGLLKPRSTSPTTSVASPNKTESILHGNFTRRVKQAGLISGASQDQEQEEIALLRLCFSQRHLDVLNLLYAYPLLETKEMAVLLNLQADSVTRYLYELRRHACIEKCLVEQGIRWYVSTRGLRLIAAALHVSLHHIAEPGKGDLEGAMVQRGMNALKTRLSHTAGIYAFFSGLHAHARAQRGSHQVLWWETGSQCERQYLDHGERYLLRPNATFAYKTEKGQLLAWLEWEEETLRIQALATKMRMYAMFTKAQSGKDTNLPMPQVLLFIVPEQHYYQRVIPVISEHLTNGDMQTYITSARDIAERGPLAIIWSQITPSLPNATPDVSTLAKRSLLDLN